MSISFYSNGWPAIIVSKKRNQVLDEKKLDTTKLNGKKSTGTKLIKKLK